MVSKVVLTTMPKKLLLVGGWVPCPFSHHIFIHQGEQLAC